MVMHDHALRVFAYSESAWLCAALMAVQSGGRRIGASPDPVGSGASHSPVCEKAECHYGQIYDNRVGDARRLAPEVRNWMASNEQCHRQSQNQHQDHNGRPDSFLLPRCQ